MRIPYFAKITIYIWDPHAKLVKCKWSNQPSPRVLMLLFCVESRNSGKCTHPSSTLGPQGDQVNKKHFLIHQLCGVDAPTLLHQVDLHSIMHSSCSWMTIPLGSIVYSYTQACSTMPLSLTLRAISNYICNYTLLHLHQLRSRARPKPMWLSGMGMGLLNDHIILQKV